VWWNSPAFKVGITPGMKLVAVNDEAYNANRLREAIVLAEKTATPIKLLLRREDHFQTVSLDYHGGSRYPKLERIEGAVDLLDAILAPVSPFPAFKIGEKVDDPLAMYLSDVYTLTGDLAGVPCMSVPCGESPDSLPIGLQIFTKHFDEATMLRIAYNYERATTR